MVFRLFLQLHQLLLNVSMLLISLLFFTIKTCCQYVVTECICSHILSDNVCTAFSELESLGSIEVTLHSAHTLTHSFY